MSDDHLTTEEISALLDRGAGEASEGGHIEDCAVCRREMELLRRMRMALSALDDREAPPGAWASLETELEQRGVADREPGDDRAVGEASSALRSVGWARAAAAAVLFVGGLGLGTHLASPGGADAGESADAATAATRSTSSGEGEATSGSVAGVEAGGSATPVRSGGGSRLAAADEGSGGSAGASAGLTYREARERLEELRERGPTFREAYRNPQAAAEHLARLDALMRASQEALREDPADPALNDFLFQVAEERKSLNRALQLSSLEYR